MSSYEHLVGAQLTDEDEATPRESLPPSVSQSRGQFNLRCTFQTQTHRIAPRERIDSLHRHLKNSME